MFRFLLACACVLFVPLSVLAQDDSPPPPDLLTLAHGAVLLSAPADMHSAVALTDGDNTSNWKAAKKKVPLPYVFVFELLAPAMLTEVGVDGAGERPGGVAGGSVGIVRVEGSAIGPDSGYVPLATIVSAPEGPSLEPVSQAGPFRWLRFTVQSAQSEAATWIYLDEVIAHGSLTAPSEPDRFTGIFRTGRKDLVELKQEGSQISGCFVENGGHSAGTLTGAVQEGVALMSWTSEQGISGTAFFTRDSTGALAGVSYRQRSRTIWGGPPAEEGATTRCSTPVETAEVAEPQDPIVAALETEGVARIYGIYFDYNRDVPKSSAQPALQRLYDALASAPDLVVDIEGHTDSDGSDAFNLDLSQRRSASVVGWLIEQGIAADRLQPVGKGEAEPVANNATADGRALNRRVEVRRR